MTASPKAITPDIVSMETYPSLSRLVQRQIELAPIHAPFLARRYGSADARELRLCNELALDIERLSTGEYDEFLRGYDFICDIQKAEELYFRRHKAYRLTRFQDAIDQVYNNKPYMQSYMRGLLVTQAHWANHTASLRFYRDRFLATLPVGGDLLEIGPGHGLLLARAVQHAKAASVTGWDLSKASLEETATALGRLGVPADAYRLEERNLFDPGTAGPRFDGVVFSEVLEHLEEPERAIRGIYSVMRPNARLYVNVPINSPAPDHIFLLRSPEEAVDFLTRHGFEIVEVGAFPATNYSIEAARRHALTISVCIIARKPADAA